MMSISHFSNMASAMTSNITTTTTTTMLLDIDKDLEEQVSDLTSCPICMEPFDHPKVLPCQHTFCLSCIQSHHVASNKIRFVPLSNFPCPTCRSICYVPPLGLHALPTDFKVEQIRELMRAMAAFTGRMSGMADGSSPETSTGSSGSGSSRPPIDGVTCAVCRCLGSETLATYFCAQCSKHFCGRCSESHCSNPIFRDHSVVPISPTSTDAGGGLRCEEHQSEMTYYCERCSTLACMLCVTCSHEDHNVLNTADAFDNVRRKTKEYSERIDEKGKEFEIKLEIAKRLKHEHSKALKEGEKIVKKAVKELEQRLKEIEKQALVELKSEHESKVQTISASEKLFQERQKVMKGLSVELSGLKSNQNLNLALNNFSTLENKLKSELYSACDIGTSLFEYACFKQDLKVALGYTEVQVLTTERERAQQALQSELSRRGSRRNSETKTSSNSNSDTNISSKRNPETKISRLKEFRKSFRLPSKQNSSTSSIPTAIVTRTSASSLPGSPTTTRANFHGDTESGRARTLRRQALVERLERRLSTVSGMTPSPAGTLDSPGFLFNLSASRRRSSPAYSRDRQISGGPSLSGRLLWRGGDFVRCRDCCFTVDGQLAATEYAGQGRVRLKIYSSEGELLHLIETVLLSQPWGICYNRVTASLVVTDHGATCSSIKNIKIASVSQVASYTCVSSSERPSGVASLSTGQLVMTDTGSKKNRVGIYSMMIPGRFSRLREFGPQGDGEGEILCASYVTVDSEDRIIISDTESKHVKIFTAQGRQVARFTSSPSEGRPFQPQGVTVDRLNNIYVSEQNSKSVIKFSPEGQQLGTVLRARSTPWGLSCHLQTTRLAVVVDSGVEIYQL